MTDLLLMVLVLGVLLLALGVDLAALLAMMGAHRELKMMAGRLSRLSFRAAPFFREGDECTARE